jgi:hypothetical protein
MARNCGGNNDALMKSAVDAIGSLQRRNAELERTLKLAAERIAVLEGSAPPEELAKARATSLHSAVEKALRNPIGLQGRRPPTADLFRKDA